MKVFTFFNAESGDPLFKVSGVEGCDALYSKPGITCIEGDLMHSYLMNGDVFQYSDDQLKLKNNRPSHACEWSNALMCWIDIRGIEELRHQCWIKAKDARDSKEFGQFSWNGRIFDGDREAQRRLNLAVLAAQQAIAQGSPWSIDWTLADNSVITLSASDMVGVVAALGQNIDAAHEEARAKRALIGSASTKEELDLI